MNRNTVRGSGATLVYQRKVRQLIADSFGAQWPPGGNGRLLDIGCGNGDWTQFASSAFETSIGVDISDSEFPEKTDVSNVEYLKRDFLAKEFQPHIKFDGIISILVFELVENPITAAIKATAMLKAGGRILVVVPNLRSLHMWLMRRANRKSRSPYAWNGVSFTELINGFERSGLKLVSSGSFGNLPPDIHLPPRKLWIVASRAIAHVAEILPIPGSYKYVMFEKPAPNDG